jgi:hypothetical protein
VSPAPPNAVIALLDNTPEVKPMSVVVLSDDRRIVAPLLAVDDNFKVEQASKGLGTASRRNE